MSQPTFLELMQFVLENKTDKCFRGYDEAHIATKLAHHLNNDTCWITQDKDNKITGMIIATPNEEKKLLFIDENLSMNSSNLLAFARRARNVYPDFKLEYYKNNQYHLVSQDILYDKLSS